MNGWTFSKHALSRAVDMAVDAHELRACIESPEMVYDQEGQYAGMVARVAGRIGLITDPVASVVVTVIWHLAGKDARSDMALVRDRA